MRGSLSPLTKGKQVSKVINSSALFVGALTINKSGVKSRPVIGGVAHTGWFIKVTDEQGRYMTSMQVKTMDETVAETLSAIASRGEVASLGGYIRTENWAPKDAPDTNWVTVFYADKVAAAN